MKKTTDPFKNLVLDGEEKEILEVFEKGEYKSVKNLKKEIAKAKQIAENTLKKNRNINIRVSERTLLLLRNKANEEGIPYQTLISSILHKYVNHTL